MKDVNLERSRVRFPLYEKSRIGKAVLPETAKAGGTGGGEAVAEEGLLHDPVSFGGDENAWGLDSSGGCVTLNARHTRDGHFSK